MKYTDFYKERIPNLPEPNSKGESVVKCVFHEDTNPSLAINLESGKWKCYTPSCAGHAGGGYRKFDQLLRGEAQIGAEVKVPPIDAAAIAGFHHVLLQSKHALEILEKRRGLTIETIKRFELGYDGDRILIPIKGPEGSYVNIRKYKYGAAKDKMIAWGARYNRARLFPFENTKLETVLLCEGETDCMLACQLGLPAITATGGADTWLAEFNEQLRGKIVYVCYDVDPAGRKGASQVALKLLATAKQVFKITLPLSGSKEEKDITDYFKNLGHSLEDFDALMKSAEEIRPIVEHTAPAEEIIDIHLSMIGLNTNVGKRVRSTVLIAGKDLAPFQVPKRIAFSCQQSGSEKLCDRCGICKASGQLEVTIPDWSQDLLQMVNVPVEKLHGILSRAAEVPDRCPKFQFEVKEHSNIESIKAIPEIDFSAAQSSYVIRSLFYLGHGIDTNKTYNIEAVVMPEPKTQYATALIYNATPSQDSIEKFAMSETTNTDLSIFEVRADADQRKAAM